MVLLVKDLMYTDFPMADGQITIKDAAKILTFHARSFIVIVQDETPVGVVTEQDFVRKVIAKGISPDKTKINEIMSQPIVTIKPDADLSDAAELMKETGIHKIIVIDEKYKLLGVITPRLLVSNFNEYVYKITRDIVRHASFTQFF
jgi:CBS domain-containing protein